MCYLFSQVLELLEVVQFRCPDTSMKYPQLLSNLRVESKVCISNPSNSYFCYLCLIIFPYSQIEEILRNSATSEFGGVYYFSERGDRLIDLDAFHKKLIQVVCSVMFMLSFELIVFYKLLLLIFRCHKNCTYS
jgi:nuclear pore complex protein Nup205